MSASRCGNGKHTGFIVAFEGGFTALTGSETGEFDGAPGGALSSASQSKL